MAVCVQVNGQQESEILEINIKPGWKRGTKITFPNKGDAHGGVTPADIVFTVDEKPHPHFRRDGNDLIYQVGGRAGRGGGAAGELGGRSGGVVGVG